MYSHVVTCIGVSMMSSDVYWGVNHLYRHVFTCQWCVLTYIEMYWHVCTCRECVLRCLGRYVHTHPIIELLQLQEVLEYIPYNIHYNCSKCVNTPHYNCGRCVNTPPIMSTTIAVGELTHPLLCLLQLQEVLEYIPYNIHYNCSKCVNTPHYNCGRCVNTPPIMSATIAVGELTHPCMSTTTVVGELTHPLLCPLQL